MKGSSGWFVLLSIIGILVGIGMVWHGLKGNGLSSIMVLLLGLFMTEKEILDIAH